VESLWKTGPLRMKHPRKQRVSTGLHLIRAPCRRSLSPPEKGHQRVEDAYSLEDA
jgi:hypothetical protein